MLLRLLWVMLLCLPMQLGGICGDRISVTIAGARSLIVEDVDAVISQPRTPISQPRTPRTP
jgi:hypothetical protein